MLFSRRRKEAKWETLTGAASAAHERCTKPPAQNAATNAKFRSSPRKAGRFTAGTVILKGRDSKFLLLA